MRSTASTHSAVAASASRRSFIGTVPAWPAAPRSVTRRREKPLIAVTTPTARPSASSTGPLFYMKLGVREDLAFLPRNRRYLLRVEPVFG